MKAIDLFCGGGGWTTGAKAAGIEVIAAIDANPRAVEWYNANHGNHAICADVRHVNPADLPPCDLILASPPCQEHSQAKTKGTVNAERRDVGNVITRYVRSLRPKHIAIENVVPYRKSDIAQEIVRDLWSMGYWVQEATLDASRYMVPQSRSRYFILASQTGWPLPSPAKTIKTWAAAIDGLPLDPSNVAPWQRRYNWPMDRPILLSGQNSRASNSTPIHREADQPAFTVTAGSKGRHRIRYPDGRVFALTAHAYARLQTFPDDYKWPSVFTHAINLIGNAVPPLLAQQILEPITKGTP